MSKVISIITSVLVALLAGCAFVLSYSALKAVAFTGGIDAELVWLWPLTLDAVMLAAGLAVLWCNANDVKSTFPWALVIAFGLASLAFNVVSFWGDRLAVFVHITPPLVVFFALELVSMMLRHKIAMGKAAVTLAGMQAQVSTLLNEERELLVSIEQLSNKEIALLDSVSRLAAREVALLDQPVDRLANLHATGRGITEYAIAHPQASAAEIARAVGVTAQNVTGHWLPKLEAEIGLHRNGNGWEL